MHIICMPLSLLMKLAYDITSNYGLAIILFTFFTKIILMPVSIWVHINSIKMVKLQPKINHVKAKYYGDTEKIAEEQTKLYKVGKYNPFLSIIPMAIQIILLMCVVYIIKEPITYILGISDGVVQELGSLTGITDFREDQFAIIDVLSKMNPSEYMGASSGALDAIAKLQSFNLSFLGFGLNVVTSEVMGIYILVPVFAGISSFIMCLAQNALNVLLKDETPFGKYGVMVISILISLVLGFFVYTGVALYWIASNLFAILVQVVLNLMINPWKRVDREELEKSRKELSDIQSLGKTEDKALAKVLAKREKEDYKRFFSIVNKHVVIYSEKSGFYKYFSSIIKHIQEKSNVTIHYITNDPNDQIFELAKSNEKIKPYYIGVKKMIPMMMKLESDMVIMTTPDLDNLYLKRSLYDKECEYIYVPHDMMSAHLGFREGAFDNFDTFFAVGPHLEKEIRALEEKYGTKKKTIVHFGYPYLEKLIHSYNELPKKENDKKQILIAPSWNEDNILDSCIDGLIKSLCTGKYKVIVRPHPEYVKRFPEKMDALIEKYKDVNEDTLVFETDFSKDSSIYSSDMLITDWSGIAYEYSFTTLHPCLFVNTKLKMQNTHWEELGIEPFEMSMRNKVGIAIEKNEAETSIEKVDYLMANYDKYTNDIKTILNESVFNLDTDGMEGAKYILSRLVEKAKNKK